MSITFELICEENYHLINKHANLSMVLLYAVISKRALADAQAENDEKT